MKISVIVPVYNAEKFVAHAVESALQFEEVHEVILIEDKSPDNALQICKELTEKYNRVKLFQHPDQENHGAGSSRNLGIEKATGDFIAFLDADDYYLPNRFDAEKKMFQNQKIEGVYGAIGVHHYSESAKENYYKIFKSDLTTVYRKHGPKDVFPGLIYMLGSFGHFSIDALTVRRDSLVHKMKILFKPHLKLHEDTEFLLRLAYYTDLYPGIIDKPVAMRGIHGDNRITKIEKNQIQPAISKSLFWNEVNQWAENEETMPKNVRIHIKRMHRSFEIAKAPSLKKWRMIIKYLFTDFQSIRSGLYNINFRKTFILI
ncbi:Glycosyltransferase involved in cell wall bisynthesis [Chryseobacterium soldanellicola]|uniref:Glycosyltransferase involved in cell wall bisynthesis n=1 Tax=Chryseobacterium soldanellicola TaxID=311333 RepID=A0A1H1A7J3_9FLAO|nr:glycosyltransferase family 2 protein [Chryseobacterium soldanellicola]SDQ35627.1 Glycosyltransferase involved in cell wall bisynthesis [Chryseobacterium soldanellicola]